MPGERQTDKHTAATKKLPPHRHGWYLIAMSWPVLDGIHSWQIVISAIKCHLAMRQKLTTVSRCELTSHARIPTRIEYVSSSLWNAKALSLTTKARNQGGDPTLRQGFPDAGPRMVSLERSIASAPSKLVENIDRLRAMLKSNLYGERHRVSIYPSSGKTMPLYRLSLSKGL